jgi:hypothetical protein
MDPDMEVDVEILDVKDDEARELLLSIDPLAALALTQTQLHERLRELTPTGSDDLRALWEATAHAHLAALDAPSWPGVQVVPEQWLILVTCRDEKEQRALLERFGHDGVKCKPLLS